MLRSLVASRQVVSRFTAGARRLPRLGRSVSTSLVACHERLHEVLPPLESFARRHIGPSEEEVAEMLEVCGVKVFG